MPWLCQHTNDIHIKINNTKKLISISTKYNEHMNTFSIIIRCVFVSLNKRGFPKKSEIKNKKG